MERYSSCTFRCSWDVLLLASARGEEEVKNRDEEEEVEETEDEGEQNVGDEAQPVSM